MPMVTVYIPIQLDSGLFCPGVCLGNQKVKSRCMVFWRDLSRAKGVKSPTRGYVDKKCNDCLDLIHDTQANNNAARRTRPLIWRPKPDVFKD